MYQNILLFAIESFPIWKYLSPSNTRQAVARYDGLTAHINIPADQPEGKRFRWKKSWLELISEKYVLWKYETTNLSMCLMVCIGSGDCSGTCAGLTR